MASDDDTYAETLWGQQIVVMFGFSPLYWRFGARKKIYRKWMTLEDGMLLMGWRVLIVQFGPFSIRFGALPLASLDYADMPRNAQSLKQDSLWHYEAHYERPKDTK